MNATRATWLPLGLLVLAAVVPLAGCNSGGVRDPVPAYSMGYYLLPAQTPVNEINVPQGSMVNLAVKVTSISNVPIAVRLAAANRPRTPATLTPTLSAEYITLQPGKSVLLSAVYYIDSNLPPGHYTLGLRGELREPVPDRAEQSPSFELTVTESTTAD